MFDAAPPGSTLAGFADEVTGWSGRCAGASDDELIGVLRAWGRVESWAAERKLAVIAELIRRRPAPGNPPSGPGGMPAGWGKFCADELAAAAAISAQAAEKTLQLAHDLASRLPGTARALREGLIDLGKARIIAEVTLVLDPAEAAAAEALILAKVAGKTPGQVRVITARAAAAVNPAAAQARRERAQKDARVELWREDAGTAALCGRDLPPAEALAADQRITAYARELKAAGLDGTMDQLRARAFLDLALGICSRPPSPPRNATTRTQTSRRSSPPPKAAPPGITRPKAAPPGITRPKAARPGTTPPGTTQPKAAPPGTARPGTARPGTVPPGTVPPGTVPAGDSPHRGQPHRGQSHRGHPAGNHPAEGSPAGGGPAAGRPAGKCPADGSSGGHQRPADRPAAAGPAAGQGPGMDGSLAAAINLTIPLATLLGLAERPGEAAGLGAIDPALARELARRAAGNPRTTWCVTVTDHEGHATGHGCARPPRRKGLRARQEPNRPGPTGARARKARRAGTRKHARARRTGPAYVHPRPGTWATRRLRPMAATTGGDRDLLADLEPLAVTDCDHRHESAGYQPSDTLRHLVHIRDAECTWPPCRRAARRCDFEHGIPWDRGGRTCSCNGGPRCRHHHHQKSPGWTVEQHQPGYHIWTTPAGRQYTTGPAEYPI